MEKTYESIDGVNLGPDDLVYVARVDLDSFNYIPVEVKLSDLMKESPGNLFWSNYDSCLEECDQENSL